MDHGGYRERNSTKLVYVVKHCKRVMHTHSGCGSLSTRKRTQCTFQSMWCSWHSLASSNLVRLSLLSSSLFSVLLWASDVAILFSRSRLRLCSEVVMTVQCRLICSHNGGPNLLRVSDWITVQLFCLCKIAQSLTQGINRDISKDSTEVTTCTEGGCAWKVSSIPYACTATTTLWHCCLDQKKGTHLLHNVLHIPSDIQASTHIPTHCTAPWVGGPTVPSSPPTAGPAGKGQKVCHTREESCSDMRWEGGSIANSQR